MTMKRLWRKLEYSQWDNGCSTAKSAEEHLYFFRNKPITYEEYKNRLMKYFKDYDEDY